jgi:Uma2 family endonuclease
MTSPQLLVQESADLQPVTELDISHLVIEDDTPVDSFQSEEQQRLLVEPLYSARPLPWPFLVAANVGLFYKLKGEQIVPDVLLSLGIKRAEDFSQRQNRSYFVWELGKVPEVCIEIVSNQEGDELILSPASKRKGKTQTKLDIYAQIGIDYYVVFDPLRYIQGQDGMNGSLLRIWMIGPGGYRELTANQNLVNSGDFVWLDGAGIGLMLWQGEFEEDVSRSWLRWCNQGGQAILTGAEDRDRQRQRANQEQQRADQEQQRADQEQQRADRLAERLRAMGINPDQL